MDEEEMVEIFMGFVMVLLGLLVGLFYNGIISKLTVDLFMEENKPLLDSDGPPWLNKLSDSVAKLLNTKSRGGKRFKIPKYMATMGMSALIFLGGYLLSSHWMEGIYYIALWSMLLIVTEIDYDYKYIYDQVLIAFTWPALLCILYIYGHLTADFWYILVLAVAGVLFFVLRGLLRKWVLKVAKLLGSEDMIAAAITMVLTLLIVPGDFGKFIFGMLAGFMIYFIIYFVAKIIYKEEAFGFGDVLLNSVLGFYFGISQILLSSILSFFVAVVGVIVLKLISLFSGKHSNIHLKLEVPFGPYMCVAAFITSLWGEQIIQMYLQYIGL